MNAISVGCDITIKKLGIWLHHHSHPVGISYTCDGSLVTVWYLCDGWASGGGNNNVVTFPSNAHHFRGSLSLCHVHTRLFCAIFMAKVKFTRFQFY